MITYLVFVAIWTAYMAFETFTFTRPQSRPHFVGFLITHTLLAPISFVLSAIDGVLHDRIKSAYRAATDQKNEHTKSGKKKLIG